MFVLVLVLIAEVLAPLADAGAFRIPGPVARANWRLACGHCAAVRDEVRAWNTPDVAGRWEAECDWRRSAWDKLDDVLYHPLSLENKVRSLARLRELIGDDAYFSGRMPSPIPHYKKSPQD